MSEPLPPFRDHAENQGPRTTTWYVPVLIDLDSCLHAQVAFALSCKTFRLILA